MDQVSAACYQLGAAAHAGPPEASGADPPVADAALRAAQVQVLFDGSVHATLAGMVAGLTFWVTCLAYSGDRLVLAWALLLHGAQCWTLLCLGPRRRRPAVDADGGAADTARRLRRYLVPLTLQALVWGSVPLHLLPLADPAQLALLALALLCVASGGVTALVAQRSAIVLWLVPLLLPLPAALLWHGGPLAAALALLALLHLGVNLLFAFGQNTLLAQALRARERNAALVRQLRVQMQRADAASREKSRFLAAASHDLRQPMHALGLFAGALERRVTDPAGRPLLRNLNRCIEALDRSFNAMLDISRLDAGVVEPALQSFPIRDVFRRLHLHFAGQAEALGLDLRFKPGGKFVRSDPQLLERVLGNLIQNAIRHTQRGGIAVVARNRGDGVHLEVWDSGCGIAAHELPRIFDEFYRGAGPGRDRSRGLGIGLAIVKRLARLLAHPLTVRSTPGRGTMVGLWVPRTDLDALHGMTLEAETAPLPLAELRTLLVVDDDPGVREGTTQMLAQWGFEVVAADSADAACRAALACADTLHGMVCDLRLHDGEDGLQAIERVRETLGHPLPAVLVTGDTSPEQMARLHDSGHPALFKPVRPKDLFTALRRLA